MDPITLGEYEPTQTEDSANGHSGNKRNSQNNNETAGQGTPSAPNPDAQVDHVLDDQQTVEAAHEPWGGPIGKGGQSRRPGRSRQYVEERLSALLKTFKRREAETGVPAPSEDELREQAREDVAAKPMTPREQQLYDEWAPSSTHHDTYQNLPHLCVEAAVCRHPVMKQITERMRQKINPTGPTPELCAAVPGVLRISLTEIVKRLATVQKSFGGEPLAGFVFGYCDREKTMRRSQYNRLFKAAAASTSQPFLQECMVKAFRMFAETHPGAGEAICIDAARVAATVPQYTPTSDAHREAMGIGKGRELVHPLSYGKHDLVHGYVLVALTDVKTGRPIIAELASPREGEVAVAQRLLRRLGELWPEHPGRYWIGDRLHSWGREQLRSVMFTEGLIPVVPWRKDLDSQNDAGHERGVPICQCGEPMKFKDTNMAFLDGKRRLTYRTPDGEAVPRGVTDPNAERLNIRFQCPTGQCVNAKGRPLIRSTKPWKHPAVFSLLPHVGIGEHAELRRPLLLRRNGVESVWASINRLGHRAGGGLGPKWALDAHMATMLLLALLGLTLKRHVCENGFAGVVATALDDLDLSRKASTTKPQLGPTPAKLFEVEKRLADWPGW